MIRDYDKCSAGGTGEREKKRAAGKRPFAMEEVSRSPSGGDATPHRDAVNPEHEDGAQGCADEARRLARPIEVERLPDETADERADDPEKNGHDDPAWIASRHDELRDDPDHQTEKYPSQNAHCSPPFPVRVGASYGPARESLCSKHLRVAAALSCRARRKPAETGRDDSQSRADAGLLLINAARQVHDRSPDSPAEAEGQDGEDDRGRAPDGEAGSKRPERPEPDACHEDDRGQESIDVEGSDPLPVLPRKTRSAAVAGVFHPEIRGEKLSLAADRAAEPQASP